MSRWVDGMSREELVEEIKLLLLLGIFRHDEVGDPTVCSLPALRRGLKRIRLRMLAEGRIAHPAAPLR